MEQYEYQEKIKKYLKNETEKKNFKQKLFLQELISNSNKALFRKEKSLDLKFNYDEAMIGIYFEPSDNSITIFDNGIGMSKDELTEYVHNYSVKKIENGEIGLFFLFIIAEKINIISKKLFEDTAYKFTLDSNSFSLAPCINDEDSGTVIYIKLKDNFAEEFTNKEKLMEYLKELKKEVNYNLFINYYDEDFQEQLEKIN